MEREISIILKVRGAKQAKKAVQDVFNQQTQTLVEGFNKRTKKTGDNMNDVSKKTRKADKSMEGFTKALGRGMAALYLYNRAWDVVGRNFESGVQLERASEQFELHVGKVSEMLPVLKTATRGIISDFDLLKTANRAFQQGIKPESMSRTFKLATVAAQRLGLQASDAINTITNAITKQDEGALNTLGIVTKVNQAYKTQAALIAKNGGVMSSAMSIQLRQSLIMQELEKRFGGTNKVQEDGLLILERFRASWKNFRAELGQTIGIALRSLISTLTSVLDLTTRLLDKANDTGGFQKLIQVAATLGGIFGAVKFLRGAKSLINLFGLLSGRGTKLPTGLKKTNTLLGAFGKLISKKIPLLGKFGGSLGKVVGLSKAITRFIPGWGTAITALTLLWEPLTAGISKAWTMGKVFFQLVNNLDENSGMSKVLKKDADELGSFYNAVENAAKISLSFIAVVKGIGQGVSEAFAPVGAAFNWAVDQVSTFTNWLFDVDKSSTVAQSGLDSLTTKVRNLTKYLGFGASVLAMFVPGLQAAGLAGAGVFGASILSDFGVTGQSMVDAASTGIGALGDMINTPTGAAAAAGPQMSTQVDTPTPRSINLDYSEDNNELLKKMNKILERQTNIMEIDSQKADIRESQRNANRTNLGR